MRKMLRIRAARTGPRSRGILIISTLVLFVLIAAAPGNAARCDGTDVWPRLSAAKRAQIESGLAGDVFASGRFFKVEKGGRVSYVFGTMHAPPRGKLRMPDLVTKSLRTSRVLLVEVTDIAEEAFFGDITAHADQFLTRTPSGFKDRFKSDEWKFIERVTRSTGMSSAFLAHARPWYIYLLMSGLGCGNPNANQRPIMDARIEQIGRNAGVEVRGLETPLQAVKAMRGLSTQDYARMVQAEIYGFAHTNPGNAYVTRLNMYRRGEVQLIWQYQTQKYAGHGDARGARLLSTFWVDRMLGRRNRAWLPEIYRQFEKGGAFVAVGALHLGGRHGLMRALQKRGYRITRIKFRF